PRCSCVRSAMHPWPTQPTKSWFITCDVIQRPVRGSLIGLYQWGIFSCSNGSCSRGTRLKNQPTLSVLWSSIGTRHSKCEPVNSAFGHRHTRPIVHSSSVPAWPSRMRRYWKPYSNSSKPTRRWVGGRGPSAWPFSTRDQLVCSHSKWTGSIEFSWHWNQLQGISENTICLKPFFQVNGSQVGTSGAGSGPRYAHSRPAFASTG